MQLSTMRDDNDNDSEARFSPAERVILTELRGLVNRFDKLNGTVADLCKWQNDVEIWRRVHDDRERRAETPESETSVARAAIEKNAAIILSVLTLLTVIMTQIVIPLLIP